jgi:AbrB family looped-hinge helix DNA binding protein
MYNLVSSMTAQELVVTRKGQVTIPIKLRRKYGIEENSKVQILEEDGKIIIKKLPSIFDLAGSSAGKISVEEVKRMLDEMRAEDA